jgi:DNA-binding IclR family transcriptional regulator
MARPAPGADRTVAVLELMAEHPDERFTLSEVARRCAMNKATAHALLITLTNRGILLRHPAEKRYSLSPRVVAIGEAARRGYRVVDFAPYALTQLAAVTGWPGRVIRLIGDSLVVTGGDADVADVGAGPGAVAAEPTVRLPHVPPLGAPFVAWSDEPTIQAWLARSPAIEVVGRSLEALPAIRRHGFSVMLGMAAQRRLMEAAENRLSHDEIRTLLAEIGRSGGLVSEIEPHDSYVVAEVAAPVFGVDGGVDLVIGVRTPASHPDGSRLSGTELLDLGGRVVAVAQGLSAAAQGGQAPSATA